MPYKRKYYKRPKRPKRSRWSNYAGAGRQLIADVSKLKRLINTEHKFYDSNFTSGTKNSDGVLYQLCTPAQGLSDIQRVGDSIKCQSTSLSMNIRYNGASSLVRVIIFEDKQNKVFYSSDLLSDVGSSQAPLSPKLYDDRFETKVLFDHVVSVDAYNPIKRLTASLQLGHHTQFSAGTTTPVTGVYKMIIISDQLTATAPLTNHFARTLFTDN